MKYGGILLGGAVAAFNLPFLGILPMRDDPEPGVEVRYVLPKSPADGAGINGWPREGPSCVSTGIAASFVNMLNLSISGNENNRLASRRGLGPP